MYIILGLMLGIGITCFFLIPKVKHQEQINHDIINQNIETEIEYNKKFLELKHAREELTTLKSQAQELESTLDREKKLIQNNIEREKEIALNKLSEGYFKAKEEYNKEYSNVLQDYVNSFQQEIKEKNIEIKNINDELEDLRSVVDAAVEANKRAAEMENKKDFYRINLSDADLKEIEELRSIAPHLRNAEPLNKVIWKVYFEKPTNDLIGRVVGSGTHIGIYKITNLKNGMCYIGQSGSAGGFADRWKQHIKRGLGADTPTRNKLYPAMLADGVENFTFEIIEECPGDKLNEREDYWQEFFKAKEFGYSIK